MKNHKSIVILCAAIFLGSSLVVGCGKEKEEEKKSKAEKLDSLRPYDRVFFTNNKPKCFHRDYNCPSIRHTRVIAGTSALIAEEEGLYPCPKCTEPYGIIHFMSEEDYKRLYGKEDNIKNLYDGLIEDGYEDLGSEEQFREYVKDSAKVKKLYHALVRDGYSEDAIGTEDDFIAFLMAK